VFMVNIWYGGGACFCLIDPCNGDKSVYGEQIMVGIVTCKIRFYAVLSVGMFMVNIS